MKPRDYKEKDIVKRTFEFSVKVVLLARKYPRDIAGSVVAKQLIRSGTSVGANIR